MGDGLGWITVGLTFVGLFIGGSAGTYRGGVRRTRLDDRRELLRVWIPWLPAIFKEWPPGADPNQMGYAYGPPRRAHATIEAFDELNRIVRLLPMKDRFLWSRIVGSVLNQLESAELIQFVTNYDMARYESDWLEIHDKAYTSIEQAGPNDLRFVDDLETYLILKTNPTIWTWARELRFWGQVTPKEMPAVTTSPTTMTISKQIAKITGVGGS